MATMKFYNVNVAPKSSSPEGTYHVKRSDNQGRIDTYVVSGGVVKKLENSESKVREINFEKSDAPWLSHLGGANPDFTFDYLTVITNAIKDIWFAFPNGQPSWWGNRKPQLATLTGSAYSGSTTRFRIYFRLNQSEAVDNNFFATYATNWKGGVELIQIPVSFTNEPIFYVYAIIDSTGLMGSSSVFFGATQADAIQPMVVQKTFSGINQHFPIGMMAITGNLTYDKKTRILTIPENSAISIGITSVIISNLQLDLGAVQGMTSAARFLPIYFDVNTRMLTCTPNSETNLFFGGSKFLVGKYDNAANDVYFFSKNWKSGGLDRGVDYVGDLKSASTIITGISRGDNPLRYNRKNFTLTVPENARILGAKGTAMYLVPGIYNLKTNINNAYYHIYIKDDGTILSQYYGLDQTEAMATCSRIGWIHTLRDEFGFPGYEDSIIEEFSSVDYPQIWNNPIKRKEVGAPLRICGFGSSWFVNTWWYMNKLLQSAGIDAQLTFFYVGSATFQQWIDWYNSGASVVCYNSTNGSDWTQATENFKNALKNNWDAIAFQQGARITLDWESNWENQWSELVKIVKKSCAVDTTILFNSTWTPPYNSVDMQPYENSVDGQKKWQHDSYNNITKFLKRSGIDVVVPNGALIWAMRRNVNINNASNDLAADSIHITNGLPMYATGLNFYETLVAKMYGVPIEDISWIPDENTPKCPVAGSSFMPITTTQRELIRQMVKLAAGDRWGFSEL